MLSTASPSIVTPGFIVACVATIIFAFYLLIKDWRGARENKFAAKRWEKRQNLIRQALETLDGVGFHFVTYEGSGVVALCSRRAFDAGFNTHMARVKRGEAKEWDKVVVYANPTYTFAKDEQTQRPIHTGTMDDLNDYLDQLVFNLTDGRVHNLSKEERDRVFRFIVTRDSRLFVPYCGGPRPEEQFAFYGKKTLEDARAMLPKGPTFN